jgi:hypothetical protein
LKIETEVTKTYLFPVSTKCNAILLCGGRDAAAKRMEKTKHVSLLYRYQDDS